MRLPGLTSMYAGAVETMQTVRKLLLVCGNGCLSREQAGPIIFIRISLETVCNQVQFSLYHFKFSWYSWKGIRTIIICLVFIPTINVSATDFLYSPSGVMRYLLDFCAIFQINHNIVQLLMKNPENIFQNCENSFTISCVVQKNNDITCQTRKYILFFICIDFRWAFKFICQVK